MDNKSAINEMPKINLDAMPKYVSDYLAEGALKGVREFLKRPDGKEILETKAAKWKATQAASRKR